MLQAERAKQQFMAYVFHNIGGDIAEAPKCQMILVFSLDCWSFPFVFFNCSAHEDSCDQISCFLYQVGFFAVPFNAIVLGLGHMRATGEGFDTLGNDAAISCC